MEQRVSLISLGVENLERARAFYKAMGWSEALAMDDIVFYQLNGLALGLYPADKLAEDAELPCTPKPAFNGMTLAYCLPSPQDVDNVLAQAVKAGGTLIKKGQQVFWGGYSGYFAGK